MIMERVKVVVEQILGRVPAVRGKGEESTKQALVLPMLDALGYDIWHPSEVCPEFSADFATKKAGQKEKVDIAVLLAECPRIYVEVKALDAALDGHEGQLGRYFNATPSVTLGVLTNGLEWRFFTDTGEPNIMDQEPFHVARFDAADQGLDVLSRFAKQVFSPEAIREYATELRYTNKMATLLRTELDLRDREPSDYLVRWILKSEGMFDGMVHQAVLDRFRPIGKAALTRVIREIVRRSISAMDDQVAQQGQSVAPEAEADGCAPEQAEAVSQEGCEQASHDDAGDDDRPRRSVVTTENELALFAIAKEQFEQSAFVNGSMYDSSTRRDVPLSIAYKDTQNYFSVYLNRPSFWLMRARIEGKKPWIAFNIEREHAEPLVPPELALMSPYAWAPVRVQVTDESDLHRLQRLVYATVQHVLDERQRPDAAPEENAET